MAITWAEFPGRKCREAFTLDGLTDYTCELPEHHPGPPASTSSQVSVNRREQWQEDHPGWEKMASNDDPFKDLT
jgi:hypothetical protein